MNRRNFFKLVGLGGLGAAGVVEAAPTITAREVINSAMRMIQNAPGNGIVTEGRHPKDLWPGIQKFYAESYAEFERDFAKRRL